MGILDGKVALITGSGSGIGRATASIMAKRGADIVIQDINESGASETAAQVRALGRRAEAYVGDVSAVPRIRQIVADAASAAPLPARSGGDVRAWPTSRAPYSRQADENIGERKINISSTSTRGGERWPTKPPWNICVNIVSLGYCGVLDVQSSEMLAAKPRPSPSVATVSRRRWPVRSGLARSDFITGQVISPNGGSAIVGI